MVKPTNQIYSDLTCVVKNSPLLSDISNIFCVSGSSSRASRKNTNIILMRYRYDRAYT